MLSHPSVFQWQQKICNSYDNVKSHYQTYLNRPGQKILDVGCSTGAAAAGIVDMDLHDYTGIDIDPKYSEFAQKQNPKGKFLTMNATEMTFPAGHFDVCLMTGMLHHVDSESAQHIFKDVWRVLKPGGVLLVSEPVFTPGKWLSNFLLSLDRGRYIRPAEGYKALFDSRFEIANESFFPFSLHRFCSFVLVKGDNA